jgi:hypothetical protein
MDEVTSNSKLLVSDTVCVNGMTDPADLERSRCCSHSGLRPLHEVASKCKLPTSHILSVDGMRGAAVTGPQAYMDEVASNSKLSASGIARGIASLDIIRDPAAS